MQIASTLNIWCGEGKKVHKLIEGISTDSPMYPSILEWEIGGNYRGYGAKQSKSDSEEGRICHLERETYCI